MELQFRFLFYGKKSSVRARLQRAVLSLLARRPRCSAVTQLIIKISRTGPLVPVPVPLLVPVSFHSKNQKKKVEKEKISVKMSMNLFRLAGDMTHVLSILVLLLRLQAAKNANGISLKTQELYLVLFLLYYHLSMSSSSYSMSSGVVTLPIALLHINLTFPHSSILRLCLLLDI